MWYAGRRTNSTILLQTATIIAFQIENQWVENKNHTMRVRVIKKPLTIYIEKEIPYLAKNPLFKEIRLPDNTHVNSLLPVRKVTCFLLFWLCL